MSAYLQKVLVVGLVWVAICVLPLAASGAVIQLERYELLPNTPGQQVTLQITGGEEIASTILAVQVGGGGPEVNPLSPVGPAITGVDLLSGIFSQTRSNQDELENYPQLICYQASTDWYADTPYVIAEGDYVTLTFDTTGFFKGDWDLLLLDTLAGDTVLSNFDVNTGQVFDIPLEIQGRGVLSVIPEPASWVLVVFGLGVGGLAWFRRRR